MGLKYNKQTKKLISGLLIGVLLIVLISKLIEPSNHRLAYLEKTNATVLNLNNFGLDKNDNQMETQFGIPVYEESESREEDTTKSKLNMPDMPDMPEVPCSAADGGGAVCDDPGGGYYCDGETCKEE